MLASTYRAVDIWRWDIMRSNCELELIIYWIVRWNQSILTKLLSSYVQKNEDILRSLGTLGSIRLASSCVGFLKECYTSHFSTELSFYWLRIVIFKCIHNLFSDDDNDKDNKNDNDESFEPESDAGMKLSSQVASNWWVVI